MNATNNIIGYLDLYRNQRANVPEAHARNKKLSTNQMLALTWTALFLGVLTKQILAALTQAGAVSVRKVLGVIALSLVLSVALLPTVWRASVGNTEPTIIQLALAFAFGAGLTGITSDTMTLAGYSVSRQS